VTGKTVAVDHLYAFNAFEGGQGVRKLTVYALSLEDFIFPAFNSFRKYLIRYARTNIVTIDHVFKARLRVAALLLRVCRKPFDFPAGVDRRSGQVFIRITSIKQY
jgi:hypothetical protein